MYDMTFVRPRLGCMHPEITSRTTALKVFELSLRLSGYITSEELSFKIFLRPRASALTHNEVRLSVRNVSVQRLFDALEADQNTELALLNPAVATAPPATRDLTCPP